MVDVSAKPVVKRTAVASGRITMAPRTVELIRDRLVKKGDVLTTAKIAGISAAKRTGDLIPLCHPLGIDFADVEFELADDAVAIQSRVVAVQRTGIEMEALSAVTVAALTIYDMCKAVDGSMRIENVHLVEKHKE
jgi:cyclic pyranopterin phosphate synthase